MKTTIVQLLIKQGAKLEGMKRIIDIRTNSISRIEILLHNGNNHVLVSTLTNGEELSKIIKGREYDIWVSNMTLNDLLFQMEIQKEIKLDYARRKNIEEKNNYLIKT